MAMLSALQQACEELQQLLLQVLLTGLGWWLWQSTVRCQRDGDRFGTLLCIILPLHLQAPGEVCCSCRFPAQDRTHRGEAKAWLVNTLAQLQHISPAARWACFHPCNTYPSTSDRHSHGRSSQQHAQPSPVSACRDAELHLLQLLTELAPADVSTLLLRDPDWLCDFLTASRDRIRAWFGGFGPTSIQHFKYGARALANYALSERAAAWQHLAWSGKHSQSPVAVAAKPHYFG